MKRWVALLSVLMAISAGGVSLLQYVQNATAQTMAPAGAGWVTLFDGKNLDNWNPIGTANWKLGEDGLVVADSGNGFLVSKDSYKDFEVRVEFWPEARSAPIAVCSSAALDPKSVSGKTAYEVNIWDTRPEPKYGTGAIVDVAAVDPMPHAADKWNTYEIIAKGDTFTVILNGQKTVDGAKNDKFAAGHIALQHGTAWASATTKASSNSRKVEIKAAVMLAGLQRSDAGWSGIIPGEQASPSLRSEAKQSQKRARRAWIASSRCSSQ